jgi:nucleoredoxin
MNNSIISGTFVNNKGENFDASSITAPVVCVYFSAHWCPPCRGFTPVLAKLYDEWNSKEKQIEIIFVSSDRDEKSWKEYFATMPWLSVQFGDNKIAELKKTCGVKYIPMLCLIGKNGKVLLEDGRGTVEDSGAEAINEWKNLVN